MQIKSKYTWMKHLDFMLIDLIALSVSFILSYYLKFHRLDFVSKENWTLYRKTELYHYKQENGFIKNSRVFSEMFYIIQNTTTYVGELNVQKKGTGLAEAS